MIIAILIYLSIGLVCSLIGLYLHGFVYRDLDAEILSQAVVVIVGWPVPVWHELTQWWKGRS